MIARAAFFARGAAWEAANEAHFTGIYMTWLFEKRTVNTPEET